MDIAGTWELKFWKRYGPDDTISLPFGESPLGLLIYTPTGDMAVQLVTADRPLLNTTDALGGTAEERAQAYSTCLAYFGRYTLNGDAVTHHLEGALFPNWSKTDQVRPIEHEGDVMILEVKDQTGRLTNALGWTRRKSSSQAVASVTPGSSTGLPAGMDRLQAFVETSSRLTGFSALELYGTGVADQYLRTLEDIVPERLLTSFMACVCALPLDGLEQALSAQVLTCPELGPIAKSLALLWYTGAWTALPDDWHTRNGRAAQDTSHVISSASYQAGLQWKVMGAHAPGSNPLGFGSWALPPEGEV